MSNTRNKYYTSTYSYSEPQHGDHVDIFDVDTHEVRFICPRCCTLLTHTYSPVLDGVICADCWLVFDVIWSDETQDAKVTVNIVKREQTQH